MLNGIDVVLHIKKQTGTDAFNNPIYDYSQTETVSNVLVAPSSSDDIVTSTNLVGKQAKYTIGIPKEDDHDWENTQVEFIGHTYITYGFTIEGIESLIPGEWNKKVMCELYE